MSSSSAHAVTAASDMPSLQLVALRSELDRVDDALHDALMRRAELVEQVAALRTKGPVPLRPGREAAIIRRLLARNRGALHPAVLVRVWREIVSASSGQQQEMLIAVDDAALMGLVSAHFGLLTAVELVGGAAAAMRRVLDGEATVAVLRWPGAWWQELLEGRAADLHVVARLPFWGDAGGVGAMVLTLAPPDPSGDDRTLIAMAGPAPLDARVVAGVATGPCVIERDGFLASHEALAGPEGRMIGAYATQMGETT